MTDPTDIFARLAAPFPLHELLWRPGGGGTALVYIEARSAMDRLDSVLGPANWRTSLREWRDKATLCRLEACIDGAWIWREDCADESAIEGTKGAASDSLKRAAVQLGVARYLYRLPDFKVPGRVPDGWFPPMPDWALLPEDRARPPQEPPAARSAPPPSKAPPKARTQQKPAQAAKGPPEWWDDQVGTGLTYFSLTWRQAFEQHQGEFVAWLEGIREEILEAANGDLEKAAKLATPKERQINAAWHYLTGGKA